MTRKYSHHLPLILVPCLRFWLAVCAVVLLSAQPAWAKEVVIKARGYGATYKSAVLDGLQSGVGQVMGVSIDSKEISSLSTRLEHESGANGESLNVALSKTVATNIAIGTAGLVSSYRILGHGMEEGQHRVDLEVVIERYETPGPENKRRRLAVFGFYGDSTLYRSIPPDVVDSFVSQFTQEVVAEFTQSRRFIVLEREYSGVSDAEKAVWASPDADIKERAKLGRTLGADYAVYGTLRTFDLGTEEKVIQISGEVKYSSRGRCVLEYRIMVPATGQIKWAGTVETDLLEKGGDLAQIERRLIQEASKTLVRDSLDNIYPMRVAQVSGGRVIINQGGQTLAPGDYLIVYHLGKELVDPYTKESLGQEEIPIARVQVVEVKAKYTAAQVIEGDPSTIRAEHILRRDASIAAAAQAPPPGMQSGVEVKPGGGVKLPFD